MVDFPDLKIELFINLDIQKRIALANNNNNNTYKLYFELSVPEILVKVIENM